MIIYVFTLVGGRILLEKLQLYRPKIAVFNGKGIYEVFSGKKEFTFGKQPECIDGTNTVSLLAQPWKEEQLSRFPLSDYMPQPKTHVLPLPTKHTLFFSIQQLTAKMKRDAKKFWPPHVFTHPLCSRLSVCTR